MLSSLQQINQTELRATIDLLIASFSRSACDELATLDQIPLSMSLDRASHDFKRRANDARAKEAASRVVQGALERLEAKGSCWDHVAWKKAYVVAQAIYGAVDAIDGNPSEAVKRFDLAIILGGPSEPLCKCISLVEGPLLGQSLEELPPLCPSLEEGIHVPNLSTRGTTSVDRLVVSPLNFETYFREEKCVVLTGVQESWKAPSEWTNLTKLNQLYGHRTVPIEVGTWPQWEEKILTLSSFLKTYMVDSGSRQDVAYLAQHALFEQLPDLKKDFQVPVYVQTMGCILIDINIWWGTARTVTPLHYDTYNNFLAQIIGYKYVRLYSSDQTPYLYVHTTTTEPTASTEKRQKKQVNISSVREIEDPDLFKYPDLARASYKEVILGPGDVLFIPVGTWHYVRSLTRSLSINFWFVENS